MLASASSLNLVQLIEALQEQEQRYQEASEGISRTLRDQAEQQRALGAEISRTLNQISGMLAGLVGGVSSQPARSVPAARRPGRPPASASAAPAAAAAAPRRRGRRSRFATTGNESVLAFIGQHGNPTSADMTAHWNSEGRGGKVENTLGPLVRAKKLKRSPNPSGRGSRYSIP